MKHDLSFLPSEDLAVFGVSLAYYLDKFDPSCADFLVRQAWSGHRIAWPTVRPWIFRNMEMINDGKLKWEKWVAAVVIAGVRANADPFSYASRLLFRDFKSHKNNH